MNDTKLEKLALLILAGLSMVALLWIGLVAVKAGKIDPNAATLVGVIVGGLIATGKDIIAAIRSYSMSAQLQRTTDQAITAANAAPPPDPLSPDAPPAAPVAVDVAAVGGKPVQPAEEATP